MSIRICRSCGGIAEWDEYHGGFVCTRCCQTERPKQTNADRIRVMTDEELAEFINDVEAEAIKRAGRFLTKIEIQRGKSQRLDWLRQEAN